MQTFYVCKKNIWDTRFRAPRDSFGARQAHDTSMHLILSALSMKYDHTATRSLKKVLQEERFLITETAATVYTIAGMTQTGIEPPPRSSKADTLPLTTTVRARVHIFLFCDNFLNTFIHIISL